MSSNKAIVDMIDAMIKELPNPENLTWEEQGQIASNIVATIKSKFNLSESDRIELLKLILDQLGTPPTLEYIDPAVEILREQGLEFEKNMSDITSKLKENQKRKQMWLYIGIGVVIAILLFVIYYYFIKKRR